MTSLRLEVTPISAPVMVALSSALESVMAMRSIIVDSLDSNCGRTSSIVLPETSMPLITTPFRNVPVARSTIFGSEQLLTSTSTATTISTRNTTLIPRRSILRLRALARRALVRLDGLPRGIGRYSVCAPAVLVGRFAFCCADFVVSGKPEYFSYI